MGDTSLATLAAVVNDPPPGWRRPRALERSSAGVWPSSRAIVFSRWRTLQPPWNRRRRSPAVSSPSVAVLPFANMSRDPDDDYFSDGLAEELINLLAHVPDLKVTARTSSFAFRGKEQDIRRIAESLGVRTILEGSVRRAGSRIRVTAQLINAEDGYHLWSERYDRELTDVFAIQDDIAQAIASCLATEARLRNPPDTRPAFRPTRRCSKRGITGERICRRRTPAPRNTASRRLRSIRHMPHRTRCWGSTISLRRRTGQAHAGGRTPDSPGSPAEPWSWTPSKPTRISCWVRLRPCTTTIGPEAARQFQLAMASPSVPAEAHWAYAALYLSTFGRFEESTAQMRRAVEQDPLSVLWRGILMGHLVCAGRYEEALEEGLKALDIADERNSPASGLRRSLSGVGKSRRSRRRRGESASQPPAAIHGHGIACGISGPARRKGSGRGAPSGNG